MAMKTTRCGFCRRTLCQKTEAGQIGGDQTAELLHESPFLTESLQIEETYCPDCERFYQQLVTFGRDVSPLPSRHTPDAQTHEVPQIATS